MSLLLDALKSTESNVAAAIEPEEDLLDERATLELLAPNSLTQPPLALVPTPDTAAAQHSAAAPLLVDDIADVQPSARTAEFAAAPANTGATSAIARANAAAPSARATVAVAPTVSRMKRYARPIAALVALASAGMVGAWLWQSNSNTVVYPERGRPQQDATSTDSAPAPSIGAVQVSSGRPADQFAYSGNAPEIDLQNEALDSAVARDAATPARKTTIATPANRVTTAPRNMAPTKTPDTRPMSTFSVSRSEGPSAIDRRVEAGYRALSAGDIAGAQHEYFAALELDPNNVDALLGAATVAARDGRSKTAAAAYAQVLKLEPGNPDATAAMAMMGSAGSTGESNESRLKILIASDDGGRPALHAALGGVYAADARWSAAAQEYFTALSKDPGNPDLAFNVAASLDQNRNSAMALTYYRQALAFARQRPAQINLNAVEQRIGQLQARVEAHAPGVPETP
ncbi:MAG TPA: tetratricopeptide repeat protein [Steroidobacteraceae bacterium]